MPEKRWKPGGSQNGKPGGGKFETVYTTQEYDKNAKEEYWRPTTTRSKSSPPRSPRFLRSCRTTPSRIARSFGWRGC